MTEPGVYTASLVASNTGTGPLTVVGLDSVEGADDAFFTDAPAVYLLDPGHELEIEVTFAPPEAGEYVGVIALGDGVSITLTGGATAPTLVMSPEYLQLPSTPIGCESEAVITLSNDGDEVLFFDEFSISGSPDIFLGEDPPEWLIPGESVELPVRFEPQTVGGHAATLQVTSNDPTLPSCGTRVKTSGYQGDELEQSFEYAPRTRADVLFVVDSSASVSNRLRGLAPRAAIWFSELEANLVDWRFTVTNDDLDCHATAEPWIDNLATMDAAVEALTAALAVDLSGGDQLLDLALSTIERTDPLDCLEGFLRDGSQLHVVLITDREENSEEAPKTYIENIRARLDPASHLVFSSLAGDGGACPDAYNAHLAAQLTGGRSFDLCQAQPDWENTLRELALISAATNEVNFSFTLSTEPVRETLEVFAGERQLDEWSYDSATQTVTLNGADNNFSLGQQLTVRYLAALECPT
jgi:hypothetical protein